MPNLEYLENCSENLSDRLTGFNFVWLLSHPHVVLRPSQTQSLTQRREREKCGVKKVRKIENFLYRATSCWQGSASGLQTFPRRPQLDLPHAARCNIRYEPVFHLTRFQPVRMCLFRKNCAIELFSEIKKKKYPKNLSNPLSKPDNLSIYKCILIDLRTSQQPVTFFTYIGHR